MKRLFVLLFALLLCLAPVAAQDEPPTSVPEVGTVEATVEATAEVTAAPAADVVVEAPTEQPVTVVNNGFSFEQVIITLLGFVLTIFAGVRMFVVPVLKANTELAKAAGEYVPQATFDKMIGVTEGLQNWAKTLTPQWQADDQGMALLRKELEDLRAVLYRTEALDKSADEAVG